MQHGVSAVFLQIIFGCDFAETCAPCLQEAGETVFVPSISAENPGSPSLSHVCLACRKLERPYLCPVGGTTRW